MFTKFVVFFPTQQVSWCFSSQPTRDTKCVRMKDYLCLEWESLKVHNGQFLSWVLISQSFQNVNGIATDKLWYPLLFKWF